MKHLNQIAKGYALRRSLFLLLAPLVGAGGYIINTQKNHARTPDDIVLTSLHAVQVKNLVTESSREVTHSPSKIPYSYTSKPNPENTL